MLNINFLIEKIKQIPPEDLLGRGVISQANDGKSFVCPFCGNGEGDEGDGLTPSLISNAWIWHCFRCNAAFDNIKIFAEYYNLDNNRDFVEIIKRAADDFGFTDSQQDANVTASYSQRNFQKSQQDANAPLRPPSKYPNFYTSYEVAKILGVDRKTIRRWRTEKLFDCDILTEDMVDHKGNFLYLKDRIDELAKVFRKDWRTAWANTSKESSQKFAQEQKDAETKQKEFEIVSSDIKSARKNLKNFVESQGGSWRGLSFDTLDKYNCGFISDWTPPLSRANGKKRTPTPRVIIPAGNHYLARLTVPIQNFKNAFDFKYIQEKPHALPKRPFGIDFVTADATKIFITEGEIDAMSLNQIYGGRYTAAIATLGAAVAKDISAEIFERLDAVFADSKKPIIIVLFDDDDAGHKNAPKFCEEFIKRGYPAVTEFYKSTDGKKIDANSILINSGVDALRTATNELVRRNSDNFDRLRDEIKQAQIKAAEIAEKQRLEFEREQKEKALQKIIFALPQTDHDNATRIYKMFGDVIRYNTETGYWGFFDNGVWSFPTSNNSALYPYTRKIVDFIATKRPKIKTVQNPDGSVSSDTSQKQPTPEQVEISQKLADKWRQAKTQRNAIELLKGVTEIHITQKDLDTHNFLLNVKNGVLDLEKGVLYPSAPELLFTKQANVIFNPNASAPVFENFIRQILPDEQTRAAVLRWLGYCLTGSVREEKFLFVHGRGGNGKGTLFKTVQHMLDDYATSFKIDTVLKQKFPKDGDAATPEIAKLCGARLAVAPEIPPGREIDTALVKNLSGGDIITARRLHSNSFNFYPTHKFVFEGNDLPRAENVRDIGFLRRFQVVDFTEDFTGKNADPTLKDKLTTDEELSGILNILLRECLEWQKSGLIVSDAMEVTRTNYFTENDFIVNFINDFCVYNSQKSIPRKAFLARLKKEYPQACNFTNTKLVDMVCSVEGITSFLDGHTHKNVFKGIAWADEEQSEFNF